MADTIDSLITGIENSKGDIGTAIENKGVTVPTGTKLAGMSALINQISVMHGPASSVDGNVVVFDGTSGDTLKDSGIAATSIITSHQPLPITDVKVGTTTSNAVSVLSNTIGYLLTNTAYNSSTNKLATMSDFGIIKNATLTIEEIPMITFTVQNVQADMETVTVTFECEQGSTWQDLITGNIKDITNTYWLSVSGTNYVQVSGEEIVASYKIFSDSSHTSTILNTDTVTATAYYQDSVH